GSKIVPFGNVLPSASVLVPDCPVTRSLKSVKPLARSAAVGTEPIWACPCRKRQNCASPKKKILFLITGPPRVPPNWFHRSSPFFAGVHPVTSQLCSKKSLASSLSLRKNSHA